MCMRPDWWLRIRVCPQNSQNVSMVFYVYVNIMRRWLPEVVGLFCCYIIQSFIRRLLRGLRLKISVAWSWPNHTILLFHPILCMFFSVVFKNTYVHIIFFFLSSFIAECRARPGKLLQRPCWTAVHSHITITKHFQQIDQAKAIKYWYIIWSLHNIEFIEEMLSNVMQQAPVQYRFLLDRLPDV